MKSLQRIKKNKKQFSETFDENREVCRGPKKPKKQKKQFSETPREIKKSAEGPKKPKKTKKNNFLRLLGK